MVVSLSKSHLRSVIPLSVASTPLGFSADVSGVRIHDSQIAWLEFLKPWLQKLDCYILLTRIVSLDNSAVEGLTPLFLFFECPILQWFNLSKRVDTLDLIRESSRSCVLEYFLLVLLLQKHPSRIEFYNLKNRN